MSGCLIILIAIIGSLAIGCDISAEAGWAVFGLSMLIIAVIAMFNVNDYEEE